MKSGFRQETSFTARIRIILFAIAAFFVMGIMGLYLSSQGFLKGLQEMASANRVLNLTGTSLEALGTSQENLLKLESGINSSRIAPLRETVRIAREQISEAVLSTREYPHVQEKLKSAHEHISQFRDSIEGLSTARFETIDELKEEIFVAREFLLDAEGSVREAQIILKSESNSTFNEIYQGRFQPLIVAGILSAVFFAFVVVVGFANSRKLSESLRNLTRATDAIAAGDLNYQATILEPDEFGKLTHEFNQMVNSLRDKQVLLTEAVDKVTRLQGITSSFSGVMMPSEVFEVISIEVHRALRADAGAIALVSEDKSHIESRVTGYEVSLSTIPWDYSSPIVDCIKTGEPFFIQNVQDIKGKFPKTFEITEKSGMTSLAYLPLVVGDQVYGALNFGFKARHLFSDDEKEFMMALTRQCAQAIHRATLFKAATDAIQIRDEFLSIASHELRTPLTPLKLQLQNMSRQVRKGQIHVTEQDLVLKIVENSDKQVDRLINLIDDLLDVSRISAGRLTLHLENFNFGEMAEEVISHYSTQMKEAKSLLDVDIDKSISVHADKVRIEQVLINLLTNAVKYAPGKTVHVKVSHVGSMARLEVRDEGQGISTENQKRIFDRFERVRDKNNIGGLGLGLYICRQIVEAHSGFIKVDSTPGKGASFTVEIPALS